MKKLLLLILLLLPLNAPAADLITLDNAALQKIIDNNKGKVIMLNFFATWCPPCRAEIPELVKLRKTFADNKLLLIGLSVDDNTGVVAPFITKNGVNYPVYMAGPSVTDAFNVTSVPHNAFIAPDGRVVISEPGIAQAKVLDQVVTDLAK